MAIMVIDGEEREVSDDAAKDVLNNENWKAAQHERDAELKEQARLINSERELMIELCCETQAPSWLPLGLERK